MCADIIIVKDFFIKLCKYLNLYPEWMQPFKGKRLLSLDPYGSNELLNKLLRGDEIEDKDLYMLDYVADNVGAPGGIIIVRNDIFSKTGGYDPELFNYYAPEDSFFWLKLECLKGKIGETKKVHNGFGIYAEDIELFHLYHKPAHDRLLSSGKKAESLFMKMNYEDKMMYINLKSYLLNAVSV